MFGSGAVEGGGVDEEGGGVGVEVLAERAQSRCWSVGDHRPAQATHHLRVPAPVGPSWGGGGLLRERAGVLEWRIDGGCSWCGSFGCGSRLWCRGAAHS